MVRPAVAIASLAVLASSALLSTAHPLCFYGPDRAVSSTTESMFCPNEQPEGFCCEPLEEALLKTKLAAAAVSPACSPLYKEVLCGVCNAYSAHIYTRLAPLYPREGGKEEQGMAMTQEFCSSFFTVCKADLGLPATYCAEHVLAGSKREYWSYPPEISSSFSDTGVNPSFPALPEKDLPLEPIDMHITPDGTKWWIAGMAGKIIQVDADDPANSIDILDISGKLMYAFEQGLLGFAFSPSFSATGVFYVSYSIPGDDVAENGKNVLSKFVFSGAPAATYGTEDVLITTSDKRSSAHASGWVGFPPSSYKDEEAAQHELYWSVGDGGPQNDPFGNAQDKTLLHGSIIRILVPSAVGGTGYTIPTGNAFDGANGEREEICAWGFRNPFRCSFDLETDDLYCGDVGQDSVEVVNIIKCGYNYGWNTFEGSRCNEGFDGADACPDLDRADYVFPTFEYCHFDYDSGSDTVNLCGDRLVTGLSVIGGYVYRGSKFADVLGGHYIFADHSTGVLHHLEPATGGGWTPGTILARIPQLASFSEDLDGELYMIEYQGNIYDLPCGSLCSGSDTAASCLPQSDNIPTYESVGCFIDAEDRAMALALDVPACQTMSAEMCSRFCATVEGATHFGMQYQRECFCSGGNNAYAKHGAAEKGECNMPCSGSPEDTCGGRFRLSVYAITGEGVPATKALVPFSTAGALSTPTATNYLGCYANVWDPRVLLTTFAKRPSGAMTVGKCREFCLDKGESLFALENGYECWCGRSYVESDGTDARCNAPCSGDPDSRCGGFLYRDIYKVQ